MLHAGETEISIGHVGLVGLKCTICLFIFLSNSSFWVLIVFSLDQGSVQLFVSRIGIPNSIVANLSCGNIWTTSFHSFLFQNTVSWTRRKSWQLSMVVAWCPKLLVRLLLGLFSFLFFCFFFQSYCCIVLLAAVSCRFLQKLAGSKKAKKKKPVPAQTVSRMVKNINKKIIIMASFRQVVKKNNSGWVFIFQVRSLDCH